MEGILHVPGLHRALPLGESRGDDAFDGDGGHRLVGGGPGEVAAAPLHLQKGGQGFRGSKGPSPQDAPPPQMESNATTDLEFIAVQEIQRMVGEG